MTQLTRREFAALAAVAAVSPFAGAQAPVPQPQARAGALTAGALFERIKARLDITWKADTVDGLKAGDAATPVTGIVTTALPTITVLRRAVALGANVVIASQPAFFARSDARTPPRRGPGGPPGGAPPAPGSGGAAAAAAAPEPPAPPDPIYAAKNAYIDEHKLVIIRLSDHWRGRDADPLALGFAKALGWTKHQVAGQPRRYDLPATTVEGLVAALEQALKVRGGIRVVGDPQTRVQKLGLLPGSTPLQASLDLLPGVDAIVAGEVREWETVEYARDHVDAGAKKALILVGRIVSEDPGMQACAEWLGALDSKLPVTHVAAGDPYWRPA